LALEARRLVERAGTKGLLFVGLFLGRRYGPGSVEVEPVLALGVVAELQRTEANDRAAIVDGLEGDTLAHERLAQEEPLTFPLDLPAAPNAADLTAGGILDLR